MQQIEEKKQPITAQTKKRTPTISKSSSIAKSNTTEEVELHDANDEVTSTIVQERKKKRAISKKVCQNTLTESTVNKTKIKNSANNISHKRLNKISFIDFTKEVEPTIEFKSFHEVYYRLLERFALGEIRKLIITMPPQHGKSMGATTLLPAYMLGENPDARIAIASYSSSLASKFNRRVQRLIDSKEYREIYPETTIKQGTKPQNYIRTSDEVEIINHQGSLLSVGREGALTGNRVDCFILDDLYKDAMEANSPLVRDNCLEWYTSVVKTRMHNDSRELIVFTRWHEEDLIGTLTRRESYNMFESFDQLTTLKGNEWLYLNFEAIKSTPPTPLDPRAEGEALWGERQSIELLNEKRRLDPLRFECMYQGNPTSEDGLLYGDNFEEYTALPKVVMRRENYTDTADMGDDYLCSVCYVVGSDGLIYVTDIVYTREPMEVSEPLVASMLNVEGTSRATIESNNGGRGFARSVQRLAPDVKVEWFHQSANKQARILSNSATVVHKLRMPPMWRERWGEFSAHLRTYRRNFKGNRWHDAADVITGIIERESKERNLRTNRTRFI